MRAIACAGVGKMSLINARKPNILEADEVLIAIKRIGICGTDIHAFAGNQPFFTYPRILGHELSGIIEAVGSGVEHIAIGDKVAIIPYMHCGICLACSNGKTNCCTHMQVLGVHTDGGMAEYVKLPSSQVLIVNELTLDTAAILEPLSIGAHAIRRAQIHEGETVLVIGAGPIGLGVARFAKLQGAKTIIMDIKEDRLLFCQGWADCEIGINSSSDALQKLLEINNGILPSTVLDATGNKESMMKAFDFVCHGGKLVYVGLVKDTISFFNPDFHSKELTLLGSRNATKEDFHYVISCLSKGLINPSYVTKKIEFKDVISYFEKGDFHTNKTMISL